MKLAPNRASGLVTSELLTVTDLDVSERFYTDVLGFRRVLDLGYGRLCMHQATGFVLALLRHPELSAFVAWVKTKPEEFFVSTRKSARVRKRRR